MKQIILTGDRPTGNLHVGHYVGSLAERVKLQNSGKYDEIYIMIADAQALTDNAEHPERVRQNIMKVALDYLAVGIDPEKDAYKVSLVYVPSYISDTMNQFKPFSLADQLRRDADLTIGDPHIGRKFEFGLAIGTLDGENWVLMLMK